MMKMKNNLDEMQEHKLLTIEKNGVWFVFWALLASILIQELIYDSESIKYLAGEWIIFMCLCFYMLIACIKNGIWDRHLKANKKTNYIVSFISAISMALIYSIRCYIKYDANLIGSLLTGIIMFFFVFVLCIFALHISMNAYKKRLYKLENESNDDGEKINSTETRSH